MPARGFDPSYDDSFGKSRILPPGYLETETTTREFKSSPAPAVDPPPRTIDGAVIPDSINIIGSVKNGSRRIGNKERDRYLSHLHFLHDEGHLEEDEYNARVEFVNSAKTSAQLQVVLEDLPPFPAPSKRDQLKNEKADKTLRQKLREPRAENAIASFILIVIALNMIILPWILVTHSDPHANQALGLMIATASTLMGVAIGIGSIVWASIAFNWG